MLEDAGQRIEDVDAVFVTHEHSDHATGVKGLVRHGHLKFLLMKTPYALFRSNFQGE